jgi:hypothetical protein
VVVATRRVGNEERHLRPRFGSVQPSLSSSLSPSGRRLNNQTHLDIGEKWLHVLKNMIGGCLEPEGVCPRDELVVWTQQGRSSAVCIRLTAPKER